MTTGKDEPLPQLPGPVAAVLRNIVARNPLVAVLSLLIDVIEETSAPPETGGSVEDERRYFAAAQLRELQEELLK